MFSVKGAVTQAQQITNEEMRESRDDGARE